MTEIPLREYIHDIENLIAKGKIVYAEQHCKNILHYYPKHIETYRLLGKSCLDLEKTSEAYDIFQRVLTVIPDDLSSLVGLSHINEQQGDLDSAIWHIELAFEIDPTNLEIQSEIRRLYMKRDNVAPERFRITQSSLVRTYLKGELFNQAIAKARAALAEDPLRIDLLLLLARTYYQSGNKMEAAETCIQIINKLPYCLEANKILFIICSSMNRIDETQIFQQRITELDPYSAFISKNFPSPSHVPSNAIMIERIDTPLKDSELYILSSAEPAAELIRILSSPISSTDIQDKSDIQKISIPFDEEEFLLRYQQENNDSDPFIDEEVDTSFQLQNNGKPIDEPIRHDFVSKQNENNGIHQSMNNLPDWLQNFSRETKMDTNGSSIKETKQDSGTEITSEIDQTSESTELPLKDSPLEIAQDTDQNQNFIGLIPQDQDKGVISTNDSVSSLEKTENKSHADELSQEEMLNNNPVITTHPEDNPNNPSGNDELQEKNNIELQQQLKQIFMQEDNDLDFSADHISKSELDETEESN